jgi:hypothetical protein
MCLTETGRLINGIKNNSYKRFDYIHLIERLIKDTIFAHSSKFCVLINHLLYSILCIITLSKTINVFLVTKFEYLSKLTNSKIKMESHKNFGDFFLNFENTIINNENMIILLIAFSVFFICFLLFTYKLTRRILNSLIVVSLLSIMGLLLAYVINLKLHNSMININKVVPLFGSDFTYVYYKCK